MATLTFKTVPTSLDEGLSRNYVAGSPQPAIGLTVWYKQEKELLHSEHGNWSQRFTDDVVDADSVMDQVRGLDPMAAPLSPPTSRGRTGPEL